ncbi:MAG: DUF3618 domain-containing protein [Streptomyces sp.]|nr:DUF3618 domain-containing protein [Streptomyces sp.]
MSDDVRTPAQIEAEIARRRQDLADTLDELAVRVHPVTIARDTKAKAVSAVDRTAGKAYASVNHAVSRAAAPFVGADGAPRLERIVPAVVAGVALVVAVGGLSSWRRRR